MKTKTIIYTLLFLLAISVQRCQCKKDDPIPTSTPVDYRPNTIFGKVVDKTTGQGLPNARVYFQKAKNVIGNPGWYTAATQYSDSSGNFSFTAIPNSDTVYSIYCTKDLFFDDGNNQTVVPYIKVGFAMQVQLEPMAWLKLHVKNVNPFNDFDEIDFNSPWGGGAGPFYGKNIDTLLYAQVMGDENVPVTKTIVKNNIQTVTSTRIFCKSFDTTMVNIFY